VFISLIIFILIPISICICVGVGALIYILCIQKERTQPPFYLQPISSSSTNTAQPIPRTSQTTADLKTSKTNQNQTPNAVKNLSIDSTVVANQNNALLNSGQAMKS
jgi:flagellar basal body-associated protein FliL